MTKDNDVFEAASKTINVTQLDEMRTLAQEAVSLQNQIDQMEEAVKSMKNDLNGIRHQRLPDMMSALQISKFKLEDGTEIKVDDFCSGSLPKEPERRVKAFELLTEYEAGDLIKTELSMKFGRDQRSDAVILAAELKQRGLEVDVAEGVHPSTLQAFAKERIRNGEPIDTEILGLYIGRVAKIKLPATKKA